MSPREPLPRRRGDAGSRGFTLLELLIVTTILGVLAMIALPVYRGVRERASIAALQKQLRAMASAEELYFVEHNAYTDDVERLDYRPAEDVVVELRVDDATEETGNGWSARVTDPEFGTRCAVVHGDVEAFDPAAEEGAIACDGEG